MVLNEISNNYSSKLPLQLEYDIVQKLHNIETPDKTPGTFYLDTNNCFKVTYPSQEILYDGKWLWSKDDFQVIVEEFDPRSSLRLIYDILNGNFDNFETGEIIKAKDTETIFKIHLKPKDQNSFFTSIILQVDTLTKEIKTADYIDFQENRFSIVFKSYEEKSIPDSLLFKIKEVNDNDLIDLRQ